MKRDKNELLRLQTMIENDRVNLGDNFLQLVENDIVKLLKDYFDFSAVPILALERENHGYSLCFNLRVSRIKNFANTQKESLDNF